MLLILTPNIDPESDTYRQLMAHLGSLQNIQLRVHREEGVERSLTEVYLIGNTAGISLHDMRSLPGVERAGIATVIPAVAKPRKVVVCCGAPAITNKISKTPTACTAKRMTARRVCKRVPGPISARRRSTERSARYTISTMRMMKSADWNMPCIAVRW